MRKIFTLALFLSLGCSIALAQPIRKAAYDVLIDVAEEQYQKKDYYQALKKYEEAYDEKQDRTLLPMIADLQYLIRDYAASERTYARLLRRDDNNEFVEKRFMYGRVLKMNGNYPDAVEQLKLFLESPTNDSLKTLAQNEIAGAEMALNSPPATKKVNMENAGRDVNTSFSEYSPAFGRDKNTMYLSAFDTKEVIIVDEKTTNYHAKIYRATKYERGWEKPTVLDEKINRPGYHNVNVSVSPDGNRMFFTRAQLEGNVMSEGKIYYSVGGDDAWSAANEVQGINGAYINKHPVVGELFGREVLFFSSNMPGGKGGFDLYYAPLEGEGKYGLPVNLGEGINTIADDETPFYLDGTLYFSSTGHPGFGGFDIFFTTWDGQKWSDPLNMSNAYNTSVDDQFFALDSEGFNGFLASNREGGRSVESKTCCNDIYTFTMPKLSVDLVVGMFDEARKPLPGGTVQLMEVINERIGQTNSQTSEKGNRFGFELGFEMPYRIIGMREGYYPDTLEFNTVGLKESKTIEQRLYLKAKPLPPPEPEYDTISMEQPILLENILYKYDSDRIETEAELDLQVVYELMTEYPDMKIELSSHTDNRGNDTYNEDLSQRRAESARRWLVRKGIARDRITAKGYGEKVPKAVTAKQAIEFPFFKESDVLTIEYIDKLENEEQKEAAHAINRRTEFKITEGPTSIIIKSTRLRKNTSTKSSNDRNTLIKSDSLKISEFSSLFGKKDLKGMPIMVFNERLVDLGKVKKGAKPGYTFEFVNRGDIDLEIDDVSRCECTEAEWTETPVKPGEKGFVKIIFLSELKDQSETVELEVFLKNRETDTGYPIIEKLKYKFELIK
ncbi:MAG: OmpA family protein [Saprospiraceae bacterium]|nr:OmpA family protein [Saprospiraceae bacterium]